ncbi:MAG: PLP-dependent aminotransferase family protein [Pseudomonadota bacterium]
MVIELDGNGDLYAQLARALKHSILEGRLPVGTRLPSTRQLAGDLSVSRNTVVSAYELLAAEQAIDCRAGAGCYVAAAVAARAPGASRPADVRPQTRFSERARALPPLHLRRTQPGLRFDLQCGEPLVNPVLARAWRAALGRAVERSDLRYSAAAGLPELRRAISAHVARRRGVICAPDDVVVVSGAQQALSLAARVLLNEGDAVAIEDPSYQLAEMALLAHGARVLPVAVDGDGLRVADLPGAGLRMVHVTPSHQFPSGTVMSLERRMALLDHAERRGAWIVEDDYDGEFRFAGPLTPALRSLDTTGRVLYVGSFSKLLFPAMRLGYVICPPALSADFRSAKMLDDLGCSPIEQRALADLMEGPGFERHLRYASTELKRRRAALLNGLRTSCARHVLVHDSGAGMHMVGWLAGWSAAEVDALVSLAHSRGLGVQSLAPFFHRRPAPAGLLLGYAGLSPKQLATAAGLLGQCLDDIKRG